MGFNSGFKGLNTN